MMTVTRARTLLDAARNRRVLVVGDMILDRYVWGRVERISPEAPVPVVEVTREDARPGGAANVACNVQALGGTAFVAGLVGDDAGAEELQRYLLAAGIHTEGLIRSADTRTITKTRIFAEHQQVVRIDRDPLPTPVEGANKVLCERVRELAAGMDAVIVEDYGKGNVSQAVVDAVMDAVGATKIPVGFDPKDNRALAFSRMTLATPNLREAYAAAGLHDMEAKACDSGPVIDRLATQLLRRWNADVVIITLGAEGMFIAGKDTPAHVIPTKAREVYDVSGAGDTVVAAAMLSVAAGASYTEAAAVANSAAGVVVGKLGTAVCSQAELLASLEQG